MFFALMSANTVWDENRMSIVAKLWQFGLERIHFHRRMEEKKEFPAPKAEGLENKNKAGFPALLLIF